MLLANDLKQLLNVLPNFISIPLENHIPVVTIDENDFYRVEYDDEMGVGINYISVNAETGYNGYTRVNWMTDTEIPIGQYGEMVDVINGSSYSDENTDYTIRGTLGTFTLSGAPKMFEGAFHMFHIIELKYDLIYS